MLQEELLAVGKRWEKGMEHQPYIESTCKCMVNAMLAYKALDNEQLGRERLASLVQSAYDAVSSSPFSDDRLIGFRALYEVAMELGDNDTTGILGMMAADQAQEFLFEDSRLCMLFAAHKFSRHSPEAEKYVRGKITLVALNASDRSRAELLKLL